jgi:hypothetical protein
MITGVWWERPPFFIWRHDGLLKLSSWHCFISTQNCLRNRPVTIDWLVLTHHHHLHWHQLPFIWNPMRKSKLTLVLAVTACFLVRFYGCLELFSNSHLSILRERSPSIGLRSHGQASCLAITWTIWSEWTDNLLELVLRLLAFGNKNQPLPPDHPENHLI